MMTALTRKKSATSLVKWLVELPDLQRTVQALPAPAFATLIRRVGLEDASELVAFASHEQLVTAFDEDLFRSEAPGERESFDPQRFVRWLEVLLEAGDSAAAARVAELSEDFVALSIDALVLVLDHDALRDRMTAEPADDDDHVADQVDKALSSSLSEEIDGYLLVSRHPDGWDAVLALVLALDRDHRALLSRVLDRCARASSELLDDLEELGDVLTDAAALAEDVEAEREERRSRLGFVEPRAARSFLSLAREPSGPERDPIAERYFRDLSRSAEPVASPDAAQVLAWLAATEPEASPRAAPQRPMRALPSAGAVPILEALQELKDRAPSLFEARLDELSFLANALVAGGRIEGRALGRAEAAEAALATVAVGAVLEAGRSAEASSVEGLSRLLEAHAADFLFRRASAALAAARHPDALVRDRGAVGAAIARLRPGDAAPQRPRARKRRSA